MNNQNRNRQLPRPNEEKIVADDAHNAARSGSRIGAVAGGLAGLLAKRRRLAAVGAGAAAGLVAGHVVGRKIGIENGARDVKAVRRALGQTQSMSAKSMLNELNARLDSLELDRNGNDEPGATPQARRPMRPSVRGQRSEPGLGRSSEAAFAEAREDIASRWGWGIAANLDDHELDDDHAQALHDEIMAEIEQLNSPGAGIKRGEDFERAALVHHIGARTVDAMGPAEVHLHFQASVQKGLIELEDDVSTVDFALVNRERNDAGEFVDQDQVNTAAVRRAYSTDRSTGKTRAAVGTAGAAAGVLGALAAIRSRKGRLSRLTNGSTIDADSTALARVMKRSPFPGNPQRLIRKPKRGGKLMPKKTDLGFMIHDPDFELTPKQTRPNGGAGKRVVVRNKAELLKWLRGMTQLSRRDFGLGSIAAEGLVDAVGLGGATSPKKKVIVDQFGNAINPTRLADPGTRSLASALSRLHEFGLGSALRSGVAKDVAVIGGADLTAEQLNGMIERARAKKKAKSQVRGGIEAVPPPGPTTLSLRALLTEFDSNGKLDRARKHAVEAGAAGVGAVTGGYASLATYKPGRPAQPGENLRGKRVAVKRKSVVPSYHVGVGTDNGGILHRTPGRDNLREVKPSTFKKSGKDGLRVEQHADDRPAADVARDATRAKGSSARPYGIGKENCEHGVNRIVEGKPISRQVRRAVGGAAVGALGAGVLTRYVMGGAKRKGK